MSEIPYLSLIIPCYNEEPYLEKNLGLILRFFDTKKFTWELLAVDDGSQDGTLAIIRSFEKKDSRVRGFSTVLNRGKGAAIRLGINKASGQMILFFDADLSTPLEETDIFLPLLKDHDIVIGIRKHKEAVILVHQPWPREFMGKFFTVLSNALLVRGIHDVTCGFKCFRAEAAQKIFRAQKIDRWVFDTEILFLAQKFGFRIAQVPIRWADNRDSRVSLFRDTLGSFRDLLRIKLNDWGGKYSGRASSASSEPGRE
jgi:dolichyl-phosphate beta-glucosyltransferase